MIDERKDTQCHTCKISNFGKDQILISQDNFIVNFHMSYLKMK